MQSLLAGIESGRTWLSNDYLGPCIATLMEYVLLLYCDLLDQCHCLHGGAISLKLLAGDNLHELLISCQGLESEIRALDTPIGPCHFYVVQALVKHLTRSQPTSIRDYYYAGSDVAYPYPTDGCQKLICKTGELILHLIANDVVLAMQCVTEGDELIAPEWSSSFGFGNYQFYRGLALARYLMQPEHRNDAGISGDLQGIIALHERWVIDCPSTFECRLQLLRGCAMWLQGDIRSALGILEQAIDLAQQHAFVYIEALANETIGQLLLTVENNPRLAAPYMRVAQQAYRRWGAEWKANMFDSADDQSPKSAPAPVGVMVDSIDFETMCGWTVALASERTEEGLIGKFMELAMLYSGSREGCLLWTKHCVDDQNFTASTEVNVVDDMQCFAMSVADGKTPVDTRIRPNAWGIDNIIPLANYVLRTKETLLDSSAVVASLLRQRTTTGQQGSLLVAPIEHRGRCVGVLYLANKLAANRATRSAAVDEKRISLLRVLSAQLVVSLENMRLLKEQHERNKVLKAEAVTLEECVEERTRDLEEVNVQLHEEIAVRKQAEQEARRAAASNRSFLHHMSHELRTPLNCIIGMAELILDTALTVDQRDKAKILLDSGLDLLQIVNDVLDLGKIQAGKLTLTMGSFCLRGVVERALECVALLAAQKGLVLAALYPATTPSQLHGDGMRVGQVLRNLLSNAVKFTERGQIVLEVGASEVQDLPGVSEFTVRCVDTGMGISADEARRLFQEFTQLDASTTRKQGGTGLGLHISKGIAALMSGDLVCESEVGRGSIFTYTFRCEAQPYSGPPVPLPPALRVVVCHPQPAIRQMLVGHLAFDGIGAVDVIEPDQLGEVVRDLNADIPHVFILHNEVESVFYLVFILLRLTVTYSSSWPMYPQLTGASSSQTTSCPTRQRLTLMSSLYDYPCDNRRCCAP